MAGWNEVENITRLSKPDNTPGSASETLMEWA
jgi:hypothetical protein